MKSLYRNAVTFGLLLLATPGYAGETPNYEAIDRHALKAPPEAEESLAKLAKYLAGPCRTDREKVRAVYRWITDRVGYDVQAFLAQKPGDTRPEAVLKDRQSICDGYANLFADLCGRMGVKAVKVPGYAKGLGYQPGRKFGKPNHAWNAVELGGKWHLIDSTWGAGTVRGKEYVKQFSEFLFQPAPEALIFSHCPEDPRWQLLPTPLTLEQFEKQPTVSRQLFEVGFPGRGVRDLLGAKSFRGFVDAWRPLGFSATVREAPLSKHLEAGQEYRFAIRSRECTEMVVINGGKWVVLEKDGDVFRGSVTARKGQLDVAGAVGAAAKKDKRYWTVLRYEVE